MSKRELLKIAREIQAIKTQLNKFASASVLLEQAAKQFRMKQKRKGGQTVYTTSEKHEVIDNRVHGNYVVDAFFDVTLSENKRDSNKIDILVFVEVGGDTAESRETVLAKALPELGYAVSDTKSNAIQKIMRY